MMYYKPWFVFWMAAVLALGYMCIGFALKWRSWSRGISHETVRQICKFRVMKIWFAEVLLQRQLLALSAFRWLTHVLIFWGFIGLLLSFFLRPMAYLGLDGGPANFLSYDVGYLFTKVWEDSFGLALLAGLLIAASRRFFIRPGELKNSQIDVVLLVFLLWLTLSGFALEGLRLSVSSPAFIQYSFVGRFFIPWGSYTRAQLQPWLTVLWTIHAFSALSFVAYLPNSKLLHSLVAPLVIAMNAAEEQDRKDIYWPDIKKYTATKLPRD